MIFFALKYYKTDYKDRSFNIIIEIVAKHGISEEKSYQFWLKFKNKSSLHEYFQNS